VWLQAATADSTTGQVVLGNGAALVLLDAAF
jgi:hypothetical protein